MAPKDDVIFLLQEKPDRAYFSTLIHKQDIPKDSILIPGKYHEQSFPDSFRYGSISSNNHPGRHLHGGKSGTAWKEPPVADGSFFDVMFSADGSTVYAGVTRCLSVPETEPATGGRAGTFATMRSDGNYVVSAA